MKRPPLPASGMLIGMRKALSLLCLLIATGPLHAQQKPGAYLGFDRNDYPGDSALPVLHKTFAYTGYWLNVPPGASSNTWKGKRKTVEAAGFGFLVLFNGRLYADIKKHRDPAELGRSDAAAAIAAAKREGFPANSIIFLDQEQGGRMLPEQRAYIQAWVDGVHANGFRPGVYCSGIPAKEDGGGSIITAEDIRGLNDNREVAYWITNDACPPSPGCAVGKAPLPTESGLRFADVWQFAQSPKRRDVAAGCPANYDRDGSCYAPG
ncbi:MAG TPA: glycoside hydrolase domain-containing protein, partial [Terriglobales bacterium]|nr:glycoside hydrolase domain-containing protein [Terriglobales bacterium]